MKKITPFILTLLMALSSCHHACPICISDEDKKPEPSTNVFVATGNTELEILGGGNPVPWESANQMISRYQQHQKRMKTVLCKKGDDKEVYINGFKFDARLIVELLYPNADLPPSKYTELMIIPAVRAEDAIPDETGRVTPLEEQRFTMIVAGVKGNKEIDYKNMINYFDPCPNKCPDNMKDVFGYKPDVDSDPDECDK